MSNTLFEENLANFKKHYAQVVDWVNKEGNTRIGVGMTVELSGQKMPIVYKQAMANIYDCPHFSRKQFLNLMFSTTKCYRNSEITIKQDNLIGDHLYIIVKNGNAKVTYTAQNINENERMNKSLAESEHPFKIKSLTKEWDDWCNKK